MRRVSAVIGNFTKIGSLNFQIQNSSLRAETKTFMSWSLQHSVATKSTVVLTSLECRQRMKKDLVHSQNLSRLKRFKHLLHHLILKQLYRRVRETLSLLGMLLIQTGLQLMPIELFYCLREAV